MPPDKLSKPKQVPQSDFERLVLPCTYFLSGHKLRSVRDRVTEIAQSPLSLERQDFYGQGGFLAQFEEEVAELLGKESAVFMPSGTMAQQIALRIWADLAGNPRIAFHPTCHLQIHEQMAYREIHHLEASLLGESDRLFTAEDLRHVLHNGEVSTLLIELPQREIGGQLPSWNELIRVCDLARSHGTKLHMDGARLWECAPFYGKTYAEICEPFDSVYVSFYKILGGFPGAILAGPNALIDQARIWQRRHGGNLNQLSPNAISAKLGMDKHLPRMAEYVAKAAEVAALLRSMGVRVVPEHPPTNMMHAYFPGDPEQLSARAKLIMQEDKAYLFYALGPGGKLEISIGESALELEGQTLQRLFAKLLKVT